MKVKIYIEGGGNSKDLNIRCREGFQKLLERSGFQKRMPSLSACGSRESAYEDFKTANALSHANKLVFLLVDSEDPMDDIEQAWKHLKGRDKWTKPDGAEDWQVLLMTTCMETWIIADRGALQRHCGNSLQESALPPLHGLEQLPRDEVQTKLARSTAHCTSPYKKGKRSFEYLSRVDPEALSEHLSSFNRCIRILNERLGSPIRRQPR